MKFSELVDVVALQGLCDSFAALTNATTTLKELDGTPIAASPWQDVCAQYHQFFPDSQQNCRKSDASLCSRLAEGERRCAHRCRNGLWDVAVPIVVGGRQVAHLFAGQFFTSPPDLEFFARQAEEFGFDSEGYLAAMARVPIIRPEMVPPMIEFFAGLARLIGELGLSKHQLEESNHALAAEKERMGESESLLRAITDAIPDPIFLKGRDGRLQFVNQAYLKAIGKPAGQVLGRMDSEIYPDLAVGEALMTSDQEVMNEGSARVLEERIQTPEGYRIHLSTKAPYRNPKGEITGIIGSARDITERKRSELALKLSEERFRLTVRNIPVVQWALDREAVFTLSDGLGLRALGLVPGEAVGQTLYDLFPDHLGIQQSFRRALLGESFVVEYPVGDAIFETHWAPLRGEKDRVEGVAGIALDVTERRRLEGQVRQAQKLESIGRLAGGVAHDFNNLLTVVLGCAEALRFDGQAGGPINLEDVSEIEKAAERARDLTRQLLTFARKQVIAPVCLELDATIPRAEKLLRRVMGEDVELKVELHAGDATVLCDPGQLEQVLVNLAVNARDAMPDGGRLTISTSLVSLLPHELRRSDDPPGSEWLRLCVSDTGTGLSPAVKASLFEPFFTTKTVGKGTGLGLATVHGIVSQAGGRIRVESEPGRGAAFEVYLPRSLEAATTPTPQPSLRANGGNECVLVVEDDEQVRGVTARALRSAGYRVEVASGASQALEVARRGDRIDLIVTDVVMPEFDGREVVRLLREKTPWLRALFVSGYAADILARKGVLDSGIEFLPKPFTADALLARVRMILDQP